MRGGVVLAWTIGILLLLSVLSGLSAEFPVSAQGEMCASSSPPEGGYQIELCIVAPSPDTTLSGVRSVSALVTTSGSAPGVRRVTFYLDGQYLLTDYEAQYEFLLPTDRFVDGPHRLEAEALLRDDFVSNRAAIIVHFQNGVTDPPESRPAPFTPTTGRPPEPGQPVIVAAVGDGASGEAAAQQVTDLIASWNPNLVLYLGDVYEEGTPVEFYNWYGVGDRFYGRFREITNPTVGDHEHESGVAPGYYDYWGAVPDAYRFEVAGWRFISLNSNKLVTPGSSQYTWLEQELRDHPVPCTLVYLHHPIYSIGTQGGSLRVEGLWPLLAQHGVDLVLSGHDHNYQRWVPLDGSGTPSPTGVTQFVVGTGGHGIRAFAARDDRLAKGIDLVPVAFGALRLELNPDGARYEFININGHVLDSGSVPCQPEQADTSAPEAPMGLTVNRVGPNRVDLAWNAATDNVGVTGYEIYRNGMLLATTDTTTSYSDLAVEEGLAYAYAVRARDAAGNRSAESELAIIPGQVRVTWTFLDRTGAPVSLERIRSVTLRNSQGELLAFTAEQLRQPQELASSRVVVGARTVSEEDLHYTVEEVIVDGRNVLAPGQTSFTPRRARDWQIRLDLYPVRFRVSDRLVGSPLTGVKMAIEHSDGQRTAIATGLRGRTAIELPPGEYRVSIDGPLATSTRTITVDGPLTVDFPVFTLLDVLLLASIPAVAVLVAAALLAGRFLLSRRPPASSTRQR